MTEHAVGSAAELEALYGTARPRSRTKEIDHISEPYARFIEASPFMVLASVGPEGLDATPRGDPAPVVAVLDRRTLALPDRPGNNRLDSLRNIVRDPRVALLFLVPGVGETIRVNGRAAISTDPALLRRFEIQGRVPTTVIVVTVERAYFHCPKAFLRSDLWNPDRHVARASLPSAGAMLEAASAGAVDAQAYDRDYPDRIARSIY